MEVANPADPKELRTGVYFIRGVDCLLLCPGEFISFYLLSILMIPIVDAFRITFLGARTVNTGLLLYSFGFMVVVVFLGSVIFNRVEQTFMDTV
jgi:ABC-type polysaccharide/polyol phosphate export permease